MENTETESVKDTCLKDIVNECFNQLKVAKLSTDQSIAMANALSLGLSLFYEWLHENTETVTAETTEQLRAVRLTKIRDFMALDKSTVIKPNDIPV